MSVKTPKWHIFVIATALTSVIIENNMGFFVKALKKMNSRSRRGTSFQWFSCFFSLTIMMQSPYLKQHDAIRLMPSSLPSSEEHQEKRGTRWSRASQVVILDGDAPTERDLCTYNPKPHQKEEETYDDPITKILVTHFARIQAMKATHPHIQPVGLKKDDACHSHFQPVGLKRDDACRWCMCWALVTFF